MSHTITVKRSAPIIVNYTLQDIMDMPSILNEDRYPLNLKSVEMLEVTKFNNEVGLSSGRVYREALARLHSGADLSTVTIPVIEYTLELADTVERTVPSKTESDTVVVELFTLALALRLDETYDMGDDTALRLSHSLVTKMGLSAHTFSRGREVTKALLESIVNSYDVTLVNDYPFYMAATAGNYAEVCTIGTRLYDAYYSKDGLTIPDRLDTIAAAVKYCQDLRDTRSALH